MSMGYDDVDEGSKRVGRYTLVSSFFTMKRRIMSFGYYYDL